MKYLLDTNICIYTIRRQPESVFEKLETVDPFDVGISSITIGELEYGIAKSKFPEKNRAALNQFLLPFMIVDFTETDAQVYGALRNDLQGKGTPIGAMDMLIAAQALNIGCILVSNNEKEFSRVEGLKLENWT